MNKEGGKCVVLITDAHFEPFKKGMVNLLMESALDRRIRRLIKEYTNRNCPITESKGRRVIRMNEQSLRRMVGYIVQRINEDTAYNPIRTLNEKFYNSKKESMIDGKLGDYDVLDGALYRKIVEDLKDKGWVEDVRMYANPKKGGKTYALYRRCDNHKFFFRRDIR